MYQEVPQFSKEGVNPRAAARLGSTLHPPQSTRPQHYHLLLEAGKDVQEHKVHEPQLGQENQLPRELGRLSPPNH